MDGKDNADRQSQREFNTDFRTQKNDAGWAHTHTPAHPRGVLEQHGLSATPNSQITAEDNWAKNRWWMLSRVAPSRMTLNWKIFHTDASDACAMYGRSGADKSSALYHCYAAAVRFCCVRPPAMCLYVVNAIRKNTIIEANSLHLNEKFTEYNFHSWTFKWIFSGWYCAGAVSTVSNSRKSIYNRIVAIVLRLYKFICKLNAAELWRWMVKRLNEFPNQKRCPGFNRSETVTRPSFGAIKSDPFQTYLFYTICVELQFSTRWACENNLLINPKRFGGGVKNIKYRRKITWNEKERKEIR